MHRVSHYRSAEESGLKEVLLSFAKHNLPWMADDALSTLTIKALQGFDGETPTAAARQQQQQAGTDAATRIDEGMEYIQEIVQVLECVRI